MAFFTIGQEVLLQTGHFGDVVQTEITKKGNTLITAGSDGRILFWDVKTRLQTKTIAFFNSEISNFSYNETKNLLVAGNYDGYIKILDLSKPGSEPIYYEKMHSYISGTDITTDGSAVAFSSADRSLKLLRNGKVEEVSLNRDVTSLLFSPDNRFLYVAIYNKGVYKLDLAQKLTLQNLELVYGASSTISDIEVSPSGKLMAIGYAGENSRAGKFEVLGLKKQNLKHSTLSYYPYLGSKPNSIKFQDEDHVLFIDSIEEVSILDLKSKKNKKFLEVSLNSFNYHTGSKMFLYGKGDKVNAYSNGDKSQKLIFEGQIQKPVKFIAGKTDSLFVEYENGVKLWNLSSLKMEMYKERFYKKDWGLFALSPNLSYKYGLFSLKPMSGIGKTLSLDYYRVEKMVFSPDAKRVAVLSKKGEFQVYSIVDYKDSSFYSYKLKPLIYDKFNDSERRRINHIRFNEKGNKIAVCGKEVKVFNIDSLVTNRIAYGYRNSNISLPVFFHPNEKELWVGSTVTRYDSIPLDKTYGWNSIRRKGRDGKWYYENRLSGIATLWSLDSFKYQTYVYKLVPNKYKINEIKSFVYLESSNSLSIFYTDNSVLSGSLDSNISAWSIRKLDCYGIESAMKSYDEKFVYVITSDGGIKVLDPFTLDEICTMYSLKSGDYLFVNPENHYKRSKNVANAIAFEEDGEYNKISEYDRYFNRPYEIMEKLGFVSMGKIELVKRLAQKKLTKDSMKLAMANKPSLEVVNIDDIKLNTKKSYTTIEFAAAGHYRLKEIVVKVNGVPLFGEANPYYYNSPYNKKSWKGKIKIPLNNGENKLSIRSKDEKSLLSNEVILNINCIKTFVYPDLHLVILSVSDYQDSQYNLRYAAKDGRDLLHTYLQKNGDIKLGPPNKFKNIYVDTLFNERGTKENFFGLREKLLSTKPEDHVYIYVSGHGLLDSSYNFWFATHDVNFDSPYERGLAFDSIEGILDGIPARQRLILMDACHSGEVLSSKVVSSEEVDLPYGAKGKIVGFNYRGTVIQDEGEEMEDASDIKQELFSNYTSRSGATVISAASGNSYALESEEWNNGVFTYSILAGLTERLADLNNDGEVSVIELSRFVNREVKERTKGQQIPNDRQENIENNFRLW